MAIARAIVEFLARLLAGRSGLFVADSRASWAVRIQREDSLWLAADRLEREGELAEASRLYLRDADRQFARGLHAHAALGRAAAAEIAVRLGDHAKARRELEEAGDLLSLHATGAVSWSLREVVWAYEKAACMYDAADRPARAAEMRRKASATRLHLYHPLDALEFPRTKDSQAIS